MKLNDKCHRSRRRHLPPRGISLLETILATAIFVASAALLGQLMQLGLAAAQSQERATVGLLLAESKLEEIAAGITSLETAGGPTPFETHPRWRWSATSVESPIEGLYLVTLLVEHVTNDDEPDYAEQLVRLVKLPTSTALGSDRIEAQGGGNHRFPLAPVTGTVPATASSSTSPFGMPWSTDSAAPGERTTTWTPAQMLGLEPGG